MDIHEKDEVYIQSFKHDGSLHRTWAKAYIIEVSETRIVGVTDRSCVIESDGRVWITREPAICFLYPDRWYNVISMIRKTGIHYYCNIASPSIYDGEAIKNIDYDLDVKVQPNGKWSILDEDEYEEHGAIMGYSKELDEVIWNQLDQLLSEIKKHHSPFAPKEIYALHDKYLRLRSEDREEMEK
ncbi:MAG: DUF402 domain-containing protein [Erysipelotrichaceae bacterium]